MTTEPVPLPARRSESAPRFDPKKPLSLWDYFIDYEALAEAAQLDERTKIKKSVIYLSRDQADFWECLDEYEGSDWELFKNTILSFYPGSTPENRWTLSDLDDFLDAQKTKLIRTRGDFAEFHRQFATISKPLIRNGLLSDLEERRLYWRALDQDFKDLLIRKVELTNPAYTERTILTLAEIRHAADLVLHGTLAETSSTVTLNATSPIPASSQVPVEAKPFSLESFAQHMQHMSAMMSRTVKTAVTSVLDQATSVYAPLVQNSISNSRFGASYLAHTSLIVPAVSREVSLPKVEDVPSRIANAVVAAPSNVKVHNAMPKQTNVKNVSTGEMPVDSKTDLNAYIEALQWKVSRRGDDEDEEGLEDLIRVLKERVSKKTTVDISHQGPQENQAVPFSAVPVPSIPAVSSLPAPESAPAIRSPSRTVMEQCQVPNQVVAEPVRAPEDALNPTVTLSVEKLLTLCHPGVREQLLEAMIVNQLAIKEDIEETPHAITYSAKEDSCSGAIAVYQSCSREAPAASSKPEEASAEESLVEEVSIEEERNLKSCVAKLSEIEEEPCVDRRIVFELFEDHFPMFPSLSSHVSESPIIETSFVYSQSPPVKKLDTALPTICFRAPPVSPCCSVLANLCRIVSVESFFVKKGSGMEKSRALVSKKRSLLPYDPGGEGLVCFGRLWAIVPTHLQLESPFRESLVPVRNLKSMFHPQFSDSHVSLVSNSPIITGTLSSRFAQSAYIIRGSQPRVGPEPYDARGRESVQSKIIRIVIPFRSHPTKLPTEAQFVRASSSLMFILESEGPRVVIVAFSTSFLAIPSLPIVPLFSMAVIASRTAKHIPSPMIESLAFCLCPYSLISTFPQAVRCRAITRLSDTVDSRDLVLVRDYRFRLSLSRNDEMKLSYVEPVPNDRSGEERDLCVYRDKQRNQQYSCRSISLRTAQDEPFLIHQRSILHVRLVPPLAFASRFEDLHSRPLSKSVVFETSFAGGLFATSASIVVSLGQINGKRSVPTLEPARVVHQHFPSYSVRFSMFELELKDSLRLVAELPVDRLATSFSVESFTSSAAALVEHEKPLIRERNTPDETHATYQYSHVRPAAPPMLPFHPDNPRVSNLKSSFHRSVLNAEIIVSPRAIAKIIPVVAQVPIDHFSLFLSPAFPLMSHHCLQSVSSSLFSRIVVAIGRKRKRRRGDCHLEHTQRSVKCAEISVTISYRRLSGFAACLRLVEDIAK